MNAVEQIFGNHITSKNDDIHWPPRSLDLTACDFSLCEYLKSKVEAQIPRDVDRRNYKKGKQNPRRNCQ